MKSTGHWYWFLRLLSARREIGIGFKRTYAKDDVRLFWIKLSDLARLNNAWQERAASIFAAAAIARARNAENALRFTLVADLTTGMHMADLVEIDRTDPEPRNEDLSALRAPKAIQISDY